MAHYPNHLDDTSRLVISQANEKQSRDREGAMQRPPLRLLNPRRKPWEPSLPALSRVSVLPHGRGAVAKSFVD